MSISLRALMLLETMAFLAAAAIHAGFLVGGYEHRQARIAETVIAAVLLIGASAASFGPVWARRAGLAAQGFALAGTIVGIFTIAIGVGPRTLADVLYHIIVMSVLIYGLLLAVRARAGASGASYG